MDSMNREQMSWLSDFLGNITPDLPLRLQGAYRATAVSTDDPMRQGRIQVVVPERGEEPCWASPCRRPGTGDDLPAAGTSGWVMFEHGDAAFPVWLGARPD